MEKDLFYLWECISLVNQLKLLDRETGEVIFGKIPPYSVIVPGSLYQDKDGNQDLHLYCAVIIKQVDEKTRSKTST